MPDPKPTKSEYQKTYFKSEAGKAALIRYRHSEKGKKTINSCSRRFKQTPKGKAGNNRRCKRYKENFPERVKARAALNNAIENGRIERGCVCANCGAEGKMHGHHHRGYAWENRFDVIWLCHSCHVATHSPSQKVAPQDVGILA